MELIQFQANIVKIVKNRQQKPQQKRTFRKSCPNNTFQKPTITWNPSLRRPKNGLQIYFLHRFV